GIDVSLTFAPLTGTDGHPIGVRKSYLEQGFYGDLFKNLKEIEGHGYVIVDNEKDLSEKWAEILSAKPDFIKVMLLYSEEYEKRKDDPAYFGRKGLDPKLLPEIVRKAHLQGLRVSVHVTTATDFHHAVLSGADEIAHVPGGHDGSKISPDDARTAAKRGITVVTTAGLVRRRSKAADYDKLFEAVKFNLKTLRDAKVRLAIGSDEYGDSSLGEATFLAGLGVYSNLEILKMWAEVSTETTFPQRKVAKLKDGYEASFLVLNGNPIENFENFQKIEMRVKQGHILKVN
ncbi:MAG: hypothetical protein AB7J13_02080, partial [Pyrinomonadaceae bacterium]